MEVFMKKVILTLLIAALITSSTVILSSCEKTTSENDAVITEELQSDETSDAVEETEDNETVVASGNAAYALTKIGTIKDEEIKISVNNDSLTLPEEDSMFKMLTYLGKDSYKMSYDSLEWLGNGYYRVRSNDMEESSYGIIDNKGNTIIPCEAAMLQKMSDRYLYVAYITEQTDNEDECFLFGYIKNKNAVEANTPGLSLPDTENGDVMYKGYAKVYDLDKMRFVPDVEIGRNTVVEACGDCFFVKEEGGYGKATLYNNEGVSVWSVDDNHVNIIANGVFGNFIVGAVQFYDTSGKELWTSDTTAIDLIESQSGNVYFSVKTDDGYYITDANGNKMSDDVYSSIICECDGVLSVIKDKKTILTDKNGNELASLADYRSYFTYKNDGIWEAQKNDMSYVIADKSGIIADNAGKHNGIYTDDENLALVYNNGKYSYDANRIYKNLLDEKLVSVYDVDENGEKVYTNYDETHSAVMLGVADLNTGEIILPCEYGYIEYAAGYIYAYNYSEQSWEIYQVELKG